jgi:hypothetical protein
LACCATVPIDPLPTLRSPPQAWQPILTPKWVVVTFLLIGLPFIAIGFALKSASDKVRLP